MFLITCIILLVALVVAALSYFLLLKQEKYVETLKPGTSISYDGANGEILDKIDDNTFIVRLEVKGMKLVPPAKPKKCMFC
jgi:preprotein translocase subunit YajC